MKQVRVAREAMGSEGQVVPQQWLAHTTAPHVGTQDRRRLDLVVHGARSTAGERSAATLRLCPRSRDRGPHSHAQRPWTAPCCAWPSAASVPHTLVRRGPQTLVVLGSEVWGRWNAQAHSFARDLLRLRACRAPSHACGGDCRLGTALLEHALRCGAAGSRQYTALGGAILQPLQPEAGEGLPLDSILHHAAPEGQSRLPLRPERRTAPGQLQLGSAAVQVGAKKHSTCSEKRAQPHGISASRW